MISYRKFLNTLRKLDIKWKLVRGGKIRSSNGRMCPVTAVGKHLFKQEGKVGILNVYAYKWYIKDIYDIVMAADLMEDYWYDNKKIRKALLKACKLQ